MVDGGLVGEEECVAVGVDVGEDVVECEEFFEVLFFAEEEAGEF